MTEWIVKAALAMFPPRHIMVANTIDIASCAFPYGPLDESVGVVDKDLDPHRRRTDHRRTVPSVVRRLGQEERCSVDLETDDRAEIPQLGGAESPFVPVGCGRRI